MTRGAGEFIPAAFELSDGRGAGWGRLLEINPEGAVLLTRVPLSRGGGMDISFELDGQKIENLRAAVRKTAVDADGYLVCGLAFLDDGQKSGVRSRLLDILRRA